MREVTFKVIPLKGYTIYLAMLPQLETYMELLCKYNLQHSHHIFLKVFNVLKSLFLQGRLQFS